MTPDERQLLTGFLQDLAQARTGTKDPEAAAMIAQTMSANPDALYLLVQHTVLADQALHDAQGRIAELEAQLAVAQNPPTSFLGNASPWRHAQTAVPATPPPEPAPYYPPQPSYEPQPGYMQQPGPFSTGGGLGSFLRSAGTTAAGVAGGEMLFEGLSGLFGGHHRGFGGGQGFGDFGGQNNDYGATQDALSDREREEIDNLGDGQDGQ